MMAAGLRLYRHPLLCFASPACGRGRPQGGWGRSRPQAAEGEAGCRTALAPGMDAAQRPESL